MSIAALLVGVLVACDTTPVVLSGTVTASPSGHGVGGVEVEVYADDAETVVAQTTTNLVGGYTLHASTLTDGAYRVRVGDRWWPDAASWADADTIDLAGSSATTIDMAVDEVGSLSGRVVDGWGNPLDAVLVTVVRVGDSQTVGVDQTDAAGGFGVPVVAAGTYRVLLVDPAEAWAPMSLGGATPTQLDVVSGDVPVGTIDITTGLPYEPGVTTRVSVASDGTTGDNTSWYASISADGRHVAFNSSASNLVAGDTNGWTDVFVHDRSTGSTTRVSVASDGSQANNVSDYTPTISADGRYVAFWSSASNLVAGDTNGRDDVFVHDRSTGTTTRVSVASDGSQANGASEYTPTISADGRYVAFTSFASNLVAGDTNGRADVFVHDRTTGTTTRVSVGPGGVQANGDSREAVISADGRSVAFTSSASNLAPGDTDDRWDMFVHDMTTGTTSLVGLGPHASQDTTTSSWYQLSISDDGLFVAFASDRTNLAPGDTDTDWDVFVHDRTTGTTTRVPIGSDDTRSFSQSPSITGDGRYVTFAGATPDLLSNGVVVHDRATGTASLVSVASDGTPADGESLQPWISADGRSIAFIAAATNLVPDDPNGDYQVYVHERPAP